MHDVLHRGNLDSYSTLCKEEAAISHLALRPPLVPANRKCGCLGLAAPRLLCF